MRCIHNIAGFPLPPSSPVIAPASAFVPSPAGEAPLPLPAATVTPAGPAAVPTAGAKSVRVESADFSIPHPCVPGRRLFFIPDQEHLIVRIVIVGGDLVA
jgi:hypothetical protein